MNPTRIYNYNKFLSTLDNNPNISLDRNKLEKDAVNVLLSKFNTLDASNNILKNEDNIKKTNINNFVKEVNKKITEKCCKDPNYYRDIKNTNTKKQNLILYISSGMMPLNATKNPDKWKEKAGEDSKKKREKEEEVEIKETITIEEEINNISDLLRIIDTYKYNPFIKYNINMKAYIT